MVIDRKRRRRVAAALCVSAGLLAGCGGGGGGDAGTSPTAPLAPSSSYAQRCAPGNTEAAAGLRTGSLDIEKKWIRSYLDEDYLWREQVPFVDPSAPAYGGSDVSNALQAYFYALLTPQRTDSGAYRDRFSFVMSTREWDQVASSGIELGYGITWTWGADIAPRNIRVALVEPGSPAALAGVQRGDLLLSADGTSADASDNAGIYALLAALYPSTAGPSHHFIFTRHTGMGRDVTLAAGAITTTSVPVSRVITAADGARVGYLVLNDYLASAEAPLIQAIASLRNQGITDLVLDMRYNGGGYLYVASELATMIAGTARTSGKLFQQLQYNSRRSAETNSSASRVPFLGTSCLLSNGYCTSQQPLPMLNLSRVYVLTQHDTCSASEAVINGLRGVDVDVRLIGGTTCGKPYGFSARDNCGYSYFPIEFSGTNAKGFGDFSDGFVPAGTGPAGVAGCAVADDMDHALGDPAEAQLVAALQYRASGSCAAVAPAAAHRRAQAASGGTMALPDRRHPARRNTIVGGRPAS